MNHERKGEETGNMDGVMITEELLEDYRSLKEEIAENLYKIEHMDDNDRMVGNDVIFDYSKGYPRPQSVVGYDYEKANGLYDRCSKRIAENQRKIDAVDRYIDSIGSSITRRTMTMYYQEGMPQEYIAKKLHKSQSRISQIIKTEIEQIRKKTMRKNLIR